MSDPVTHAEIEDVLSSIRRLVSETGRSEGSGTPPRKETHAATRLVLTPALRVSEAEAPAENAGFASAGDAGEARPFPLGNDYSAPAPEPEAAAEETRQQPEDTARPRSDVAAQVAARVKLRSVANVAATPVEPETESGSQTGAKLDEPGQHALQADPEKPSSAEPTPMAAPWSDPNARLFDAVAKGNTTDGTDAGDSEPAAPLGAGEAERDEGRDPARQQWGRSARVAAVVRRIAELETETRSDEARKTPTAPDINEDDIDAVPASSGSMVETLQWEDHHHGQSDTAARHEAEAKGDADAADSSAGGDAGALVKDAVEEAALEKVASSAEDFLDEESLRELVADIVREELQGPLGERITRNVRKLVRREIQRALAAQDLL